MIVVDTNLLAYLIIEGERTEAARGVWKRDPEWRLPPLWRSEFLNVLATMVRSSLMDPEQAQSAWSVASELVRRGEREPSGEAVLEAALRCGLSAYDAYFVVLAEDLDVTLVTGDREMLRACPERACAIEDFA